MTDRSNQQKLDDLWWRWCTPEGLATIADPIAKASAAATWGFTNPALDPRDMRQVVADIPKDAAATVPGAVWGYTNPGVSGGDAYQILRDTPANVLNQQFTLPDGTVTNLAGILTAIHATPAPAGTSAVATGPQAVVKALAAQLNK